MKPDDPNITWIEEPKLGLAGRMYLPLLIGGVTTTVKHLFSPKVTVSFPEERPKIGNPLIYRGVHRLNKDPEGRVKCVACFLCSTACPAHCIDIVAAPSPWPDREKYPESFSIDELRCIFCGMCEEACPVDAIELTSLLDLTGRSREEMVYRQGKTAQRVRHDERCRADEVRRVGGHGMTGAWNQFLAWARHPHPLTWGIVLGGLSLWLMLPRGSAKGRGLGAVLGIAALGCLGSRLLPLGQWDTNVVFWILSSVTIVSAACTVTFRSPMYCAVWFAMTLVGTAGIFMLQGAAVFGRGDHCGLCRRHRGDVFVRAHAGAAPRRCVLRPSELGRFVGGHHRGRAAGDLVADHRQVESRPSRRSRGGNAGRQCADAGSRGPAGRRTVRPHI